jgi:hypothetical protein
MSVKVIAKHTWFGAPIAGINAVRPSEKPQDLPKALAQHLVDTHPYWFSIVEEPENEPVAEIVSAPVTEIAPQSVDRMARTSRRRK